MQKGILANPTTTGASVRSMPKILAEKRTLGNLATMPKLYAGVIELTQAA